VAMRMQLFCCVEWKFTEEAGNKGKNFLPGVFSSCLKRSKATTKMKFSENGYSPRKLCSSLCLNKDKLDEFSRRWFF
jgi:hypothetical protein